MAYIKRVVFGVFLVSFVLVGVSHAEGGFSDSSEYTFEEKAVIAESIESITADWSVVAKRVEALLVNRPNVSDMDFFGEERKYLFSFNKAMIVFSKYLVNNRPQELKKMDAWIKECNRLMEKARKELKKLERLYSEFAPASSV